MTTKVKCDKSNLGINNMLPCLHYLCGGQRNASLGGKEIPCDQLQVTFGRYPHAPFPARGNGTNEIVTVANETVPAWVETAVSDTFGKRIVRPSLSAGHSIA
ncbi:hypothetical protein [Nitrosospira sp. Nsp14]|uniref:hypothetical protein n=1 Tax=Nitrosospira sp. Nsp14 TaxID=1855333 RepID=UPI000B899C27|nr:hypothetical protein [Nitrosospira sp. Nsp14]